MKSSFIEDKTIAEYFGGKLKRSKKRQLEKKMATSNQCLDEMLTIHSVLQDKTIDHWETLPVSKNVSQALLKKINNVQHKIYYTWSIKKQNYMTYAWSSIKEFSMGLGRLLFNAPQLQTVSVVRSIKDDNETKNCIVMNKKFDDLNLDFSIINREDGHFDIHISVATKSKKMNAIRAILVHEQGAISSQLIKQNKLIKKQPFGKYQLTIEEYAIEKGVFSFEINEDGIYER